MAVSALSQCSKPALGLENVSAPVDDDGTMPFVALQVLHVSGLLLDMLPQMAACAMRRVASQQGVGARRRASARRSTYGPYGTGQWCAAHLYNAIQCTAILSYSI